MTDVALNFMACLFRRSERDTSNQLVHILADRRSLGCVTTTRRRVIVTSGHARGNAHSLAAPGEHEAVLDPALPSRARAGTQPDAA
jgi:hypothetical protein